jgi:hypothetical protein
MHRGVQHFTVGQDSRSVGRGGFFHFLVHRDASRENGCTQYAEADAKTWHGFKAGGYDANSQGPGVEFERLVTGGINAEGLSDAQPLTQNQLDWGARIIAFYAEWGIPVQLYDGPRYQYGDYAGWINHQALDSDRSDGLLRSEWDAMTGGDDVTPEQMAQLGQWMQEQSALVIKECNINDGDLTNIGARVWGLDTGKQVQADLAAIKKKLGIA